MKSSIIRIVIVASLLFVAVFLLKKSHDKINTARADSGISSEIVVSVVEVVENQTNSTLRLTGTLQPYVELQVASQVAGSITSLCYKLGQYKTKGSVLATVDNTLKKLAVQSAELNYNKQKRDLARFENLYQGGTLTTQQVEDARMALESARIQLEQARKQLADATVTAPVSGIITEKLVEQGAYVNVGNPLLRMVDVAKLKIKLNVSEKNVYKIKLGDRIDVTTDVYPGVQYPGRITFISSKGDEAHNYAVEAEMVNSSKSPLKAGTFADVRMVVSGKALTLSIPRGALQGSTQDARVYVVSGGKAQLRKIVVGEGDDQNLEVLSGLAKGENVVVAGQINLVDGQPVKVVKNK